MTVEYLLFLAAGAATGGFVNGLAGFGTALLALSFWLHIMSPVAAVSIVVVMAVVSGFQGAWIVRKAIFDQPKRLARFLIPGLIGVPLGVSALAVLDPQTLKITIGALMVLYGGFFSLRKNLPKIQHPTPVVDCVVGFLGGILGGAASLSGALPTMWCATRQWTKAETRAVLQPYNITILALALAAFFFNGNYTWDVVKQILLALPVTLVFAQIGIAVYKRLSDDQFRQLLISTMFLAGSILLIKELV